MKCLAVLLVFSLYIGISASGAVLLIVGESPPEMEPDKYLNLTHRYMSEEVWLSWFHEQRKKLVLFTAGPPIIVIGFFFCRPLMFFHQRSLNRQAGIMFHQLIVNFQPENMR